MSVPHTGYVANSAKWNHKLLHHILIYGQNSAMCGLASNVISSVEVVFIQSNEELNNKGKWFHFSLYLVTARLR